MSLPPFTTGTATSPTVPTSAYDLTSAEEIQRLFSNVGVEVRVDDTDDGGSSVLSEIIAWASETITSYTLKHYDTTQLVNSAWIRRRATILAAYYLSQRRGNPPQFVAEVKRIMEELELVNTNKILIPDAPVRAADVPAISSYRVDDRYIMNKQRVVSSQSTKPYAGQQKYDLPYNGNDFV